MKIEATQMQTSNEKMKNSPQEELNHSWIIQKADYNFLGSKQVRWLVNASMNIYPYYLCEECRGIENEFTIVNRIQEIFGTIEELYSHYERDPIAGCFSSYNLEIVEKNELSSSHVQNFPSFYGKSMALEFYHAFVAMLESGDLNELLASKRPFYINEVGAGGGEVAHEVLLFFKNQQNTNEQWALFWNLLRYRIYEENPFLSQGQQYQLNDFSEKGEIVSGNLLEDLPSENGPCIWFFNQFLSYSPTSTLVIPKKGASTCPIPIPILNPNYEHTMNANEIACLKKKDGFYRHLLKDIPASSKLPSKTILVSSKDLLCLMRRAAFEGYGLDFKQSGYRIFDLQLPLRDLNGHNFSELKAWDIAMRPAIKKLTSGINTFVIPKLLFPKYSIQCSVSDIWEMHIASNAFYKVGQWIARTPGYAFFLDKGEDQSNYLLQTMRDRVSFQKTGSGTNFKLIETAKWKIAPRTEWEIYGAKKALKQSCAVPFWNLSAFLKQKSYQFHGFVSAPEGLFHALDRMTTPGGMEAHRLFWSPCLQQTCLFTAIHSSIRGKSSITTPQRSLKGSIQVYSPPLPITHQTKREESQADFFARLVIEHFFNYLRLENSTSKTFLMHLAEQPELCFTLSTFKHWNVPTKTLEPDIFFLLIKTIEETIFLLKRGAYFFGLTQSQTGQSLSSKSPYHYTEPVQNQLAKSFQKSLLFLHQKFPHLFEALPQLASPCVKASTTGDLEALTEALSQDVSLEEKIQALSMASFFNYPLLVPLLWEKDLLSHLKGCPIEDTALHIAMIRGHQEVAHALLKAGFPLDLVDSNQKSVLSATLARGNVNFAKFLFSEGANPCTLNEDGITCFEQMVKSGYLELVTLFYPRYLSLAPLESEMRRDHYLKPLLEALHSSNESLCAWFYEYSPCVQTILKDRGLFVENAIAKGELNKLKLYIKIGGLIPENLESPTHLAYLSGNIEMLEYILREFQADPDALDQKGQTVIECLIEENKSRIDVVDWIELLLHFGANPDGVVINGIRRNLLSRELPAFAQALLIEYKADIECLDAHGRTPLLCHLEHGRLDAAHGLLKCQANPNHRSIDGRNAGHYLLEISLKSYETINCFGEKKICYHFDQLHEILIALDQAGYSFEPSEVSGKSLLTYAKEKRNDPSKEKVCSYVIDWLEGGRPPRVLQRKYML